MLHTANWKESVESLSFIDTTKTEESKGPSELILESRN